MEPDIKKILICMARNQMNDSDLLKAAGIQSSTWSQVKKRGKARPVTIGKIAKGLNVDVTEIIKD